MARQAEVDALTATLTTAQADNVALTAQAAELAEQLKTARIGAALVPGLQERIADLSEQLHSSTTSLQQSETALHTSETLVETLKARIAELERPPVVVTEPVIPAGALTATPGQAKTTLAKVPDGGTLVLRGGDYNESLATIAGKSVTIMAYPGEKPYLDGAGTMKTALIASGQVTVRGIGFRNHAPASITNGSNAPVYLGGTAAGSLFEDCTFSDSTMASLAFQVANLTIRRCTFTDNGFSGVMGGYDGPTMRLDGFVFENNIVRGMNRDNHPAEPTTAGVKLTRATNAIIRNNTIEDVPGAYGLWLDVSCLNPLIEGNTINGAPVSGRAAMKHCAELELSEGGTVRGNTFTGATAAGLKVYNTGHVRVENNRLRGGNCGLWLAQDARRNGGTALGNLKPSDVPWVTRATQVVGNDLDTLWAYSDDRTLGGVDMVAALDANKFTATTIRWGRAGTTDQALTVAAAQATLK